MTPGEMLRGGEGLLIHHGVHETRFGPAFIASTTRGVCHLRFIEAKNAEQEVRALRSAWPHAELMEDTESTGELAGQLFLPPGARQMALPLLVRGTNFQVKVWEALLRVPHGQVTTYGRIAEAIGAPRASRAVGGAVGANPIAWLIPCHRVIREEGILGNYRWGAPRKAALLAWELQASITGKDE
jgi:AraC family transcriptional regulator of adaptative response/methylated-DNA-[protein]-cysteine methyltransferase